MSQNKLFISASEEVNELLERPKDKDLLSLYGLFKQATLGDCKGKRPSMINIRKRAKFDAWASLRGKKVKDSEQEYINLVNTLKGLN